MAVIIIIAATPPNQTNHPYNDDKYFVELMELWILNTLCMQCFGVKQQCLKLVAMMNMRANETAG